MSQTSILVDAGRRYPDRCAWCGASPATLYVMEKARHTTAANGVRVLKKAALEVPVCAVHRRRFDAQNASDE